MWLACSFISRQLIQRRRAVWVLCACSVLSVCFNSCAPSKFQSSTHFPRVSVLRLADWIGCSSEEYGILPSLFLFPLWIAAASFPLIVDAIFGFSFDPKNGIREPYRAIIEVSNMHNAAFACPGSATGPCIRSVGLLWRPCLLYVAVCLFALSVWCRCSQALTSCRSTCHPVGT